LAYRSVWGDLKKMSTRYSAFSNHPVIAVSQCYGVIFNLDGA